MTDIENIASGTEIEISGTPVIFTERRPGRWTWYAPAANEGSETTFHTALEAYDHACRTLGKGECKHGSLGWCPKCHDEEN